LYDDGGNIGYDGVERRRRARLVALLVVVALVVGFGAGILASALGSDDGDDDAGTLIATAGQASDGSAVVATTVVGSVPTETTGAEPVPGDAANAAVTAIEATFRRAFGGDDESGLLAVVDDPTGLAELRDELRERYPEMLGGRVTYEITDIRLTSETDATFRFRPVIADYAEMPVQVGGARLVGTEWKITRDTACAMFRLGGAVC
jgi:hypothetical protein